MSTGRPFNVSRAGVRRFRGRGAWRRCCCRCEVAVAVVGAVAFAMAMAVMEKCRSDMTMAVIESADLMIERTRR